jgi:hypothetical protein
LTAPGCDYSRIHADGVEATEEAGVLDFHAPVHHHLQAGTERPFSSLFVDHS